MIRRPPRSTRTDTLFPDTTLFRSLHELLLRAGEVVTKDEILDAVWPGLTVVEGSLATAISKLRKALGGDADAIIATVPRVGYRLVAPVAVNSIDTPLAPRFAFAPGDSVRSDERRVGKECVSTCRSRWSQYPSKKKK